MRRLSGHECVVSGSVSYVWEIGIAKGEGWVCRGEANLEMDCLLMKLLDVER